MRHKRLILAIIIVLTLILLMIYSSVGDQYNNRYPDTVIFQAKIIEIDKPNQTLLVIFTEHPPYNLIEVKADHIDSSFKKGDNLEIFGILDGESHVTAEKITLHEQWKDDLIYIRSIPAIPFALFLFFKTWKFNRKIHQFEKRGKNA